jgi:ribosomal protein S18 acetylase RimI-like enzyme
MSRDPGTEIRRAAASDTPSVIDLLEQLFAGGGDTRVDTAMWRERLTDLLASDRLRVLVAEDANGVLGVISFSFNQALRYGGEYAQIEELIVDPRGRGRKLGAALVQAAIGASKERGCAEIGLYAREETRAFYEKLGFRYTGPELRLPLG